MRDHRQILGVFFVSSFVVMAAIQEVYLGRRFQTVNPIQVMFFTFLIAAGFFWALQLRGRKSVAETVRMNWMPIVGLNMTTLVSWLGFFLALKWLEPAVESAICFAMTPLATTIAWKWFRPTHPVNSSERLAAFGVLFGVVLLSLTATSGVSSIGDVGYAGSLLGVFLAFAASLGIVGNTYFSKILSEQGLSAPMVMAVRFPLLIVVGGALWLGSTGQSDPLSWTFLIEMVLISFLTIVGPLYLLQLGVERCEPITVSLLFSSSPVVTYFLQLFDERLRPSLWTLGGITVCILFVLIGILSRLKPNAMQSVAAPTNDNAMSPLEPANS